MEDSLGDLLKIKEKTWYRYAKVTTAETNCSVPFEMDRYDFLPELIPFSHHGLWHEINENVRKQIASYGWVMYNQRTIAIESDIISPLCNKILSGNFKILSGFNIHSVVAQTLVDEGYHTLLSLTGYKTILNNRNLKEIKLGPFNFQNFMHQRIESFSLQFKKEMTLLGTVIASEVLISDYLASLSNSEFVQPFCREITRIHWHDELAHANIFKLIAKHLYSMLDKEDRDFLVNTILDASNWFCDRELESWEKILLSVDCPRASEIIDGTRQTTPIINHQLARRRIDKLIKELSDSPVAEPTFQMENIQ